MILELLEFYRFWFIILSVISGVALIYSLMVIMMPTTRESIIKRSYRSGQSKEISSLIRRLDVSNQFRTFFNLILVTSYYQLNLLQMELF